VSLRLEIRVPDSTVLSTRVLSLQARDASGAFGLLPGCQAFLTLLSPCVISLREAGGRERYAAADGGVLLVEGNRAAGVTPEAAVADRLADVAERAARMPASRRKQEQQTRTEFAELQTSLLRELHRTGVVS
jgi:F-type H+-transporting ATPase subunit epsilon